MTCSNVGTLFVRQRGAASEQDLGALKDEKKCGENQDVQRDEDRVSVPSLDVLRFERDDLRQGLGAKLLAQKISREESLESVQASQNCERLGARMTVFFVDFGTSTGNDARARNATELVSRVTLRGSL